MIKLSIVLYYSEKYSYMPENVGWTATEIALTIIALIGLVFVLILLFTQGKGFVFKHFWDIIKNTFSYFFSPVS